MMITANVLQRTFKIKCGNPFGTCFTIEFENRQYIVTAKHIVENIVGQSNVEIMQEGMWKTLPINLVGHADGNVDISVLAAGEPISPTHPLNPTRDGIVLGQDVYFLGFPYGLGSESTLEINRNFPIPFVKKAIISLFDKDLIMLDGHNNPGFSGGPVVFHPRRNSDDLSVAGVVSGYRPQEMPVYRKINGSAVEIGFILQNTGIIHAYAIENALNLIRQNPIGVKV